MNRYSGSYSKYDSGDPDEISRFDMFEENRRYPAIQERDDYYHHKSGYEMRTLDPYVVLGSLALAALVGYVVFLINQNNDAAAANQNRDQKSVLAWISDLVGVRETSETDIKPEKKSGLALKTSYLNFSNDMMKDEYLSAFEGAGVREPVDGVSSSSGSIGAARSRLPGNSMVLLNPWSESIQKALNRI